MFSPLAAAQVACLSTPKLFQAIGGVKLMARGVGFCPAYKPR